jgi:hypothetical protein
MSGGGGGVLRCGGGCVVRGSLLQGHCGLWCGLYRGQQISARHVGYRMIRVNILPVECQSGFVGGG